MKLSFVLLVAAAVTVSWRAHAFSVSSPAAVMPTTRSQTKTVLCLLPHGKREEEVDLTQQKGSLAATWARNIAVAGTILASCCLAITGTSPALPVPPAHAVEISSGAFSVQTTANVGSGIVDAKTLIATLIKNRKAVAASFDRILGTVKQELSSPVWREIQKEVLQIEGDVVDVKINPPSDITQTLKDLSQGKVNFILNGEIVNIAVDEKFSKEQDELVIRVQGFKGIDLSGAQDAGFGAAIGNVYALRWQQRLDAAEGLWDISLGEIGEREVTAGPVVVGSLALTIVAAYGGSYAYWSNERAQQEAAAEAKRQATATKKAAKKANEENE